MKYLVKLFVVTFILSICTYASAENKITYIDLKYVLNNSKAGKGAQDYLKKTFKIYRINSKKFLQDFNILSIQRSLKIIGIFSRLFKRDKKSKYLKYIPYTWKLLEMRMDSDIFLRLKEILDKNISKKLRKKIIC